MISFVLELKWIPSDVASDSLSGKSWSLYIIHPLKNPEANPCGECSVIGLQTPLTGSTLKALRIPRTQFHLPHITHVRARAVVYPHFLLSLSA